MKKFFLTTMSLSLLLLLAGFAEAAALTVNMVGKYEGTAKMVQAQQYTNSTKMVVRILSQNGPLFYAAVAFPDQPEVDASFFNGVIYEGEFRLTSDYTTGGGRFIPSTPPYLSGYFHSISVYGGDEPPKTGVFYLKRTSADPNK